MKKYLFYLFFLFLVLFFYLWQQVQVIRLGYKIELIEKEIEHYNNQNQYLRIKIGELTSLDYAEQVARDKLGMETAKNGEVIILPKP